ncbi:MAG TPA: LysR family transcriptional regulator [Xanthobacteraceae bacterium]|nr:LysR family transcriptional regulator [Xanthobacteraceae bacterium]
MLDLRTLAIFARVAERRSFVRAAQDLGITQAGASNAVRRLEQRIGVPLLARTTRRVSLTEDGAALFERSRQILADLDETEQVIRAARLKPSGRLRVDMPICFGRLEVVPLLGEFLAQYPDIRLIVSSTDRYSDLVEEEIDVAIRLGPLQDSSLIARRLTRTQFRLVGAPSYLAAHGRPRSLDDLSRHSCLAFTAQATRRLRAWRFRRNGEEVNLTPSGAMTFSDAGALAAAALAGYGLAQMRDYYTDDAIAAGGLVPLLEKLKPDPDPISLVYPPSRHLSPKVRVFTDYMVAQFV